MGFDAVGEPGIEFGAIFHMSTTQHGRNLSAHGVETSKPVHFNLSAAALYEHAIRRQEGQLAIDGPLVCRTGAHTGRSPNDKFVVKEPGSEAHVWWGKVNKPIEPSNYDVLRRDIINHLKSQELFVQAYQILMIEPAWSLPAGGFGGGFEA